MINYYLNVQEKFTPNAMRPFNLFGQKFTSLHLYEGV